MTELVLLVHTGSTLAMFGLIWFVQIVHYPLFALASRVEYVDFAAAHQFRTTAVVGPLMLLEMLSAAALALVPPPGQELATKLGLGLLALVWLSTAAIQVPLHKRLEGGFETAAHRRLVRSNWLRTAAWTLRAALALFLVTPAHG